MGVLVAGIPAVALLLAPAGASAETRVTSVSASRDPLVVAAGQIAGRGRADSATAKLLDRLAPDAVLALGDTVDGRAGERDFKASYGPAWGRWRRSTRPVPGEVEYRARGGRGYFGYFGAAAGARRRGYYSFNLGAWHLVALNSNCRQVGGCGPRSAQVSWLRADLAAHRSDCTLAYWHHPRFTSGPRPGTRAVAAIWQVLHQHGVEAVLNAHNPSYERFAPQDPAGRSDPVRGIREFVVGTGGQPLLRPGHRRPNSRAHQSRKHGVLALELSPGRYTWRFAGVGGGMAFKERGAARCHAPAPAPAFGGDSPLAVPDLAEPSPSTTPAPSNTPAPSSTPAPSATPAGPPPVVTIAGDIAGGDAGTNDEATAAVVESINPTVALTAGDNAYVDGTLEDYMAEGSYDDTWGRFKAKTRPTPGNHEYHVSGAPGYFDYFNGIGQPHGPAGERGKGYYSFDLGAWHLVALNSEISMASGSAQEQWLRADLAGNPGCTLAYWHRPRFSSGAHGSSTSPRPLWQALHEHGADVVVAGHDHHYERFALQDPSGAADPAGGIREFVVGTGGGGLYPVGAPLPNSEVRRDDTFGVLKLTLRADRYDWRFEPAAGGTFTDSGSTTCHAAEAPAGRYAIRGMIDRDSSSTGFDDIAGLGFNFIDSTPATVGSLTGDLKGLVWIGDYDNGSCSWEVPDSTVVAQVGAHAGDPRVGVWTISDEPDPYACPDAYAQHKARVGLIKAIDPDSPVLIVLDSNSGQRSLDQMEPWASNGDLFALDPYTCHQGTSTCAFGWIDRLAARADQVGMRYLAMVQAFGDPDGSGASMEYVDPDGVTRSGRARLPTPGEMHEQFQRWRASAMLGYIAFAWSWPAGSPAMWLANQPALQSQLAAENGS